MTARTYLVWLGSMLLTLHSAQAQSSWTNHYPYWHDIAVEGDVRVLAGDVLAVSFGGREWRQVTGLPSGTWRGVVFGSGKFVAVDKDGLLASSPDGREWIVLNLPDLVETPPIPVGFQRIEYFDGRFFILGGGVFTSMDGVNWKRDVPSAEFESFRSIASGGGRLVAAGYRGTVAVSTNGQDWGISEPFGRKGLGAVYHFGESFFLETARDIFSSSTGRDWEYFGEAPRVDDFLRISLVADGRVWAAGVSGDVYQSTNSIDWTAIDTGNNNPLVRLRRFGGTFYACGGGQTLLISEDGNNWRSEFPQAPATRMLSSVASNGSSTVAVGTNNTLLRYEPGSEWTSVSPPVGSWLYSAESFQGQIVASGWGGEIYTSLDGLEWTRRETPTTNAIVELSVANNRLFARAGPGQLLWSDNGADWALSSFTTNFAASAVHYVEGLYVMGGARIGYAWPAGGSAAAASEQAPVPRIMVSSNLVDWIGVPGDFGNFYSGASGNGILLFAGGAGRVAISTNGWDWENVDPGREVPFEDAIFANGRFYLAGDLGVLHASADGRAWEVVQCPTPSLLYGLASTGDSLIAVGAGGTIVEAPFDVWFGQIDYSNGTAGVRVYGPGSGTLTVESSLDLKSWTPIKTVGERANPHVMKLRASTRQFLRAVHSE